MVNILLAKTISDLGKRVLLIDADLRKPQIHKRLELNNLRGLSNYLADDSLEIEDIIQKVPNIVDISYGRGVGYSFTEHDLGEDIHNISATQIREQLRSEGKLN